MSGHWTGWYGGTHLRHENQLPATWMCAREITQRRAAPRLGMLGLPAQPPVLT